ncbi:A disintegrin and metalloproteinase with thrombospondin motifs 9 isoform X2 [Ciona intestinalis]
MKTTTSSSGLTLILFVILYLWNFVGCTFPSNSDTSRFSFNHRTSEEPLTNRVYFDVDPSKLFTKKQYREDQNGNTRKITSKVEENLAHGFDENEVVVPIRVHHVTGHPVHHGRHFRTRKKEERDSPKERRRRDVEEDERETILRGILNLQNKSTERTILDVIPDQYRTDYLEDEFVREEDRLEHGIANYSLDAFGERFLLHLTPFDGFLAPNYTLHYMGDAATDGFAGASLGVPRHCFYSGYVNERPEHTAVLSVCSGLFGAFRTDTSDYLIQPEHKSSGSEHDETEEEGTKRHRIFRRSTRAAGSKGKSLCGYTDSTETKEKPLDRRRDSNNAPHDFRVLNDLHDLTAVKNQGTYSRRKEEDKRRSRRRLSSFRRLRMLKLSRQQRTNPQYLAILRNELNFFSKMSHLRSSLKPTIVEQHEESNTPRSRKKRYLSYPRNVEVMVTADNAMLRSHDDVEHYVLTLMAIVNHVYRDPSIENLVNIVLVKLIVIGDSQVHNGPRVARDAHTCLRNFCEWQFTQNDPDDSHPDHHDTSVLITGQDICRSNSVCDTLGLAELGTMCDLRKSCSINEDNGLSTAFTIAHEIGHEFNAPHDNNDKCLDARGATVGLNVMSPTLDNNAHPWSWSKCSAKYITSFLDNGNGQCLLDEPPQRVLSLPTTEPGQVFDANAQCSFVYGAGVRHCDFMFQNTCQRLWCINQNRSHGCRTPHVPWADGTSCGDGKQKMWCQRGHCVPEDRHRVPVDGNWGEWSRFGECSRRCGGGIKSATRKCDSPKPRYGGRYCTGKRKKFRPCNFQECSVDGDFRAEQCAAYNNWARHHRHRIRGIAPNAEWIPKYDGILLQDRCKLICQVKSDDQYAVPWYVLKPKVINGTPCGPDTNDICVEGVCKMAGCDHVLNSRTTVDECGICNGDNSACRTVQGSYNTGYNIGYNRVVIIPAGANNIVIMQRSYSGDADDFNYLALRDSRGNYILNGNRSVMKNKHKIHKRNNKNNRGPLYQCDYTGTDTAIEKINCSKAIEIDIIVEVLSAGDLMPPNINYRYNIPVRDRLTYRWDPHGPWSPCSRLCDGKTKGKIMCVRSDQQIVSDRKCIHLPKPSTIIRPCNTRCQFTWHPKPSECSVRCGRGTTHLEFECRKVTNVPANRIHRSNHVVETVSDGLCPQPKPGGVSSCEGDCLSTRWTYGEWGECSRSCGGGSQTRSSVCRDSRGLELNPTQCEDNERVVSRTCGNVACPQWVVSAFSPCMATCGSGVRQRRVWCAIRGAVRPNNECSRQRKPPTTTLCSNHDCPTWSYDNWGPCSVTCGEGTSVRLYRCVDHASTAVDDGLCNTALLRPDTRACYAQRACDVSRISRTYHNDGFPSIVSRGLAEREAFALTTLPEPTTVPPTTTTTPEVAPLQQMYGALNSESGVMIVNRRRENARWRTGSWTPCSSSCGSGVRERYVSCRLIRSDVVAPEEECASSESRPTARETCEDGPCHGTWRTGVWTQCSVSCDGGTRTRYVRCLYNGRYQDDGQHCLPQEKPSEDEICSSASCPTTTTTTTSATTTTTTSATTTTATTTTATTTEATTSVSSTTEQANTPARRKNRVFDPEVRPRLAYVPRDRSVTLVNRGRVYESNRTRLGHWRTGPWSQCSSTCGGGTQKRAVVCYSPHSAKADCDSLDPPPSIQLCNADACPRWKRGRWGKCSKTCNGGRRLRNVYCVMSDGRSTYKHRCNVILKPVEIEPCRTMTCPGAHRWRKSAWSACSASCGRGTKSRTVNCLNANGETVADAKCLLHRTKPRVVRRCVKQRRCPRWRTGRWNQCSASCGVGIQLRRVNCRYKRKVIVDELCDVNSRPDDVTRCNVTDCPSHKWHAERWRPCSVSCGEGTMTRVVTCRSLPHNRVVDPSLCNTELVTERPLASQQCNNGPCNAFWRAGAWSECTKSCGPGIQRRPVKCSYVDPMTYKEKTVTSCRLTTRPYAVRDCDRGRCDSEVYWRVGSWSECSRSCGEGRSMRRVVCTDRATQSSLDDAVCEAVPSFRPDRTRICQLRPCIPTTCRELQSHRDIRRDGEYYLEIGGVMARIYCKGMGSSNPTEYLTLPRGGEENYSEIYGYRLINADTCPNNGSRDSSCACHRDYPEAGRTMFRKVRLDVVSMRVLANKFTFATTQYGKEVPFGMAGDCYSRGNCPQGEFRMDFTGTGFVVSSNTRWLSYGEHPVRRIQRSRNGLEVSGTCGGYCSRCQPDPLIGLQLSHQP